MLNPLINRATEAYHYTFVETRAGHPVKQRRRKGLRRAGMVGSVCWINSSNVTQSRARAKAD